MRPSKAQRKILMKLTPILSFLAIAPIAPVRRATPRAQAAAPQGDEAIRNALLRRLAAEPWWDEQTSNVFVTQGKVIYQGIAGDPQSRHAAREIALRQAGVEAVWDARVPRREWQGMA